ncbi:phage major capsid protein [Nocardiopsis sp. CT-R113]|uniref:Phage major capsid protein n=1 Tax=Nocardiopsis codii TaxID=3065942 RepID=A0ABU7KGA5_9ACTN|nr:phage major capsid protein [Nocardiopsis sp. CT-R113]MEE2041275.1 phage major capsid protein [Nocardiopsis sp. CT-R113]
MAPVTLAEAKKNTTDHIDLQVIDEFRKSSFLLDSLTFDDAVNPAGGGATLTYTYTRLATERPAAFREYNTEYEDAAATRERVSVDLSPLGGSYSVDRVLGNLGPAASNEVAFQTSQVIKSTRAFFSDQVINGERTGTGDAATGFDGLNSALSGSSTEYRPDRVTDWSTFASDVDARQALDAIDEWLGLMDDTPGAIMGNGKTIARLRSMARAAGYYSRTEDAFGRTVENYAGVPFRDLGAKAGSNDPVVEVGARTVDGAEATNVSDLYAVRFGLDGFHAVTTAGGSIVRQWAPDFSTSGAVKRGEVELGPVAVVLKQTRAASVFRNIKVAA